MRLTRTRVIENSADALGVIAAQGFKQNLKVISGTKGIQR